jgi:branched-chain amino acid transport system permease protein
VFLYYVILALALLTNWVTIRCGACRSAAPGSAARGRSRLPRARHQHHHTKLTAFAIGAMFGGFAGAFFATRQGFISPESFTFIESALVLAIVVLGGMGSQLGVALAACHDRRLRTASRCAGFDQYRMLVFGLAMVLMMIWRPRG